MTLPALLLFATILPPAIDEWKRTETAKPELPLPAVAKEFGLEESESATYQGNGKKFKLAAYRLKDVTGAVALEQSLQDRGKIFRFQNYVFETMEGTAPRGALDAYFFPTLPKMDRSAPPTLIRHLPAKNRIRGSERYILGPESLKAFEPRIPVAAAGFDFSAELQSAQYTLPEGKAWLGVIQYPNHLIARQQYGLLEKAMAEIPSGAITRQGPLVAIVLPSDPGVLLKPDSAQALAGQIQYKAEIVMDKKPPKPEPNPAGFILNIFKLCGILLVACLVFGLLFAGGLTWFRQTGGRGDQEHVTSLRI